MDAYPDAVLSGRARAAEGLRMLYVDPRGGAPAQRVARAKDLGFSQVLLGPPWAGFTRRGHFLARDFRAAQGSDLLGLASAAKTAGVDLLLDVQIDRLAAGSTLAGAAGSPFQQPDDSALLDPRIGVDADAAMVRLDNPGDALALAAWWVPVLRRWSGEGVAGFRLLGLSAFPDATGAAGVRAAGMDAGDAARRHCRAGWSGGGWRVCLAALVGFFRIVDVG